MQFIYNFIVFLSAKWLFLVMADALFDANLSKVLTVLFATNFQKYQFLGLTVIKRVEVGWRKYYHATSSAPHFFLGICSRYCSK